MEPFFDNNAHIGSALSSVLYCYGVCMCWSVYRCYFWSNMFMVYMSFVNVLRAMWCIFPSTDQMYFSSAGLQESEPLLALRACQSRGKMNCGLCQHRYENMYGRWYFSCNSMESHVSTWYTTLLVNSKMLLNKMSCVNSGLKKLIWLIFQGH